MVNDFLTVGQTVNLTCEIIPIMYQDVVASGPFY